MSRKTIFVRLVTSGAGTANEKAIIVGVTEAANRLGVSERTIYRLLRSGDLQRADGHEAYFESDKNVSDVSDKNQKNVGKISRNRHILSDMSDRIRFNKSDMDNGNDNDLLKQQLREKDVQIAQMLMAQQEMAHTIQRLQEQMYELAHLVLTHNVAAAQAKAEAELKLQEKASASERRGWPNLLGQRGKR